ncbi:MAG: hypothetical protein FWC11_01515 [Firmicutes bacterium]|nr:hypothetical protein [Bacillota bacterium]
MCKVSGGINKFVGSRLNDEGAPNSKSELYDKFGDLKQERWYDSNGDAIWDRDWKHKWDPKHGEPKFPHDHDWDSSRDPVRTNEHLEVNSMFC